MSNQLPYSLNPGANIPGSYQAQDNNRMQNNNPYPSGVPNNLPYPTQTPAYPSAPPNLPNQQFYPAQTNQPSNLPYPVEGQPVHLQIPDLPEPQVHQAPYQYPPNYPGQLPYPVQMDFPSHPGQQPAPNAEQGEEPFLEQSQIESNEGRFGFSSSKIFDRGMHYVVLM